MTSLENNKRIARNTIFLYFRMLVIMLVSLYTSRIVLNMLGITDYGIYNVVCGVVAMMTFLNSSLGAATQRFLNFEMGKGDDKRLKEVFSMSFFIFAIIAVLTIIVSETAGLWFVSTKLVIPAERLDVAINIFHFSVISIAVSILMIPYNASIIAHEKMSVYAYVSIFEAVMKLAMVFLLQYIDYDKLYLYGIMLLFISCLVALMYYIYCIRTFNECHLSWSWNKSLMKGIFSFSGWMLSGTVTNMLSTQGVNMIINLFFGPAINGARAIALQVNGILQQFSSNFMIAVKPQIVKSYAKEDFDYLYRLVFSSSKISFYLLSVLIFPILMNMDQILELWLGYVPAYATLFTQLVLIDLMIMSAYAPIAYVSEASGNIRNYQLVISIGSVLIAALSLLSYYLGFPVEFAFYIAIIINSIGLFMRLWVLKYTVKFPVKRYLVKVFTPVLSVALLSVLSILLVNSQIDSKGLGYLLLSCVCSFVMVGLIIIFVGLNSYEKNMLLMGLRKLKIKSRKNDKNR